jgi:uncharacterized membrane protein YgdD (TMEM256/DUF423 family)
MPNTTLNIESNNISNGAQIRNLIILGAVLAGTAVAIGAFGAHGLKATLAATGKAETFETAARYQMYHALAILLLAALAAHLPAKRIRLISWLFSVGIVFFSGSLYVLSLTGVLWLGAVAPIGGLSLMAAWLLLTLSAKESLKV